MTIGRARTMPFALWPCGPEPNIRQCQPSTPKQKRPPEGGPLPRLSDPSAARRALKLLCDLSIAQRGRHYLAGLVDTWATLFPMREYVAGAPSDERHVVTPGYSLFRYA